MRVALLAGLLLPAAATAEPAPLPPLGLPLVQPGPGAVDTLAFRPNGTTLLTASRSAGTVRVWRLPDGSDVTPAWLRERKVGLVAVTPDGKRLAIADPTRPVVAILDPDGKELATVALPEKATLLGLTLSPDGKWLAGGERRGLHVWDATTGKLHRTLGDGQPVHAFAFTPDGRTVVFGAPGQVRVWSLAEDKELLTLTAGVGPGRTLTVSPDGKRVATGEFQRARVWDLATGAAIAEIGCANHARSVAFSPDGRLLAVGVEREPVRVWDVATAELVASGEARILAAPPHGSLVPERAPVVGVAFSPDGRYLAAGSDDLTRVWNLPANKPDNDKARTITAGPSPPRITTFSPDGRFLVAFTDGGQVVVHATDTGKEVSRRQPPGEGWTVSLRFAPDGASLIVCQGRSVTRWAFTRDGQIGDALFSVIPEPPGPVVAARLTPDGKSIVAAGERVGVVTLDATTGKETARVPFPRGFEFREPARAAAELTGETYRLQPINSQGLRVDLATGKAELMDSRPDLHWFASSPDGRTVYGSVGWAHKVPVAWDGTPSGERELHHETSGTITAMAVSADGSLLAAGVADGSVSFWDVRGRRPGGRIQGHTSAVRTVALSPDGKTLVTTAGDQAVKFWDVARVVEPVPMVADPGPYVRPKPRPVDEAQRTVATKAQAVFKAHCYRCHGQDGAAEGGFSAVLDAARLTVGRRVVPGQPDKSHLLQRVLTGQMPPEDEKVRPSAQEQGVLKEWIAAGAPDWADNPKPRPFVTAAEVVRLVQVDRDALPQDVRDNVRYFTLTHLYNAGWAEDELQTMRVALSKLLNSLSLGPKVVNPVAIDPTRTILRVDLRDYKLDAWRGVEVDRVDPYGLVIEPDTPQRQPLPIRADAFIALASRPPHYHRLLQLPERLGELEKRLGVDAPANIAADRVLRAGFNGSGVSRHNRLVERHDGKDGYYWRSYDFGHSNDRHNLFRHPQGPSPGENTFVHDGGEVIFRLPNGLQAYFLTDGHGNRIDRGPTEIVSDPKHPDRVVENGISCMSCHARGMIDKADQIRPHVERNPGAFPPAERARLLATYAPREAFSAALAKDAESYRQAVQMTGARLTATEPIVTAALRYEADLDLTQAAAELWMTPEQLWHHLDRLPSLARTFGVLRTEGGTVQRATFLAEYSLLVSRLRLGRHDPQIRRPGDPGIDWPPSTRVMNVRAGDEFEAGRFTIDAIHRNGGSAPAVSPSLKFVAAATSPTTVKLFDPTGKEVRELTATQPADFNYLAFSPDGSLLAAGGRNESLRVWDVATGKLIAEHAGLTPNVQAVLTLAFRPDNKALAVGTTDGRSFKIVDVATLKPFETFGGHSGWLSGLAYAPDGGRLFSADQGGNGRALFWDLATSRQAAVATAPARSGLRAAAFSPDGTKVAGVGVGVVHLWDVKTCDLIGAYRLRTDRERPLDWAESVCFSPDGKYLVAGHGEGLISLWDAANFKELLVVACHGGPVKTVAFSPDGRRLATTDATGAVRFWNVRKMLAAAAGL